MAAGSEYGLPVIGSVEEEKICFKSSGQEIGVSCGSIACMFILSFSSFNSLHKKLIFKSNNPWNPLIGLVDSA